MKIKVELQGRDFVELDYNDQGELKSAQVVGCRPFLEKLKSLRQAHGLHPRDWPLPQGQEHTDILIRELILKAKGQWNFPYAHAELCHCRTIPTQVVDQAIIAGAHLPELVSAQTTASTACGTCRPNVEEIIQYRLQNKSE